MNKEKIGLFFTKIGAAITWSVIIFGLMLSGGCATGRVTSTLRTIPSGTAQQVIVTNKQWVPNFMLSISKLKFNFVAKGSEVTDEQQKAIEEGERVCRIYTRETTPNIFVSGLAYLVPYSITGYFGVGKGARAIKGALDEQYAEYGAWAAGATGGTGGMISNGGKVSTFDLCGRDLFDLSPELGIRVMIRGSS